MVDIDYGLVLFADEDISEEIGELYNKGLITKAEDIYSKDISEKETDGEFNYLLREIMRWYDIDEEDIRIHLYSIYTAAEEGIFERYSEAKREGYEYFGILDRRAEHTNNFLVFVAVKSIGKNGKVNVRKKDDSRENWLITVGFKNILSAIHACVPSIRVDKDRVSIEVLIGKDIPHGFDYMKYSEVYRDKIIDLVSGKINLLPIKQDMCDCRGYGKVYIEYKISDKAALLVLLKLHNIIIKEDLV